MSIRVLVVDDQALVRAGFRMILDAQDDIEVVGEAENGEVALVQSHRLQPDVVPMDVRMPVMDGIEATRRLAGAGARDPVFIMTGSVVVALKALVMSALSLGATLGVLVWVFQEGHLSEMLGFDSTGSLDVLAPVLVLLFAFGLSTDYEVFLLSRVKEVYERTGDNATVVRTLLVPATMKLMGDWNWWAPRRRRSRRRRPHDVGSPRRHGKADARTATFAP